MTPQTRPALVCGEATGVGRHTPQSVLSTVRSGKLTGQLKRETPDDLAEDGGLADPHPSDETGQEGLVPMMVQPSPALVTTPRRDPLDDATAADLRQRIRLALSLLGHRADDDNVLHELLVQTLTGVPLLTLAGVDR